ncbi:MAG: PQQ-binding-like beta-propeller repeat protein [Firmicutes bacterium]|nr:PQQ-binding-like beta-propeller repeat protein [Bacillota bacterium]MCL5040114.1 PQQ-binding-like beta-propeller repeat protein [Bacillota bacterium]
MSRFFCGQQLKTRRYLSVSRFFYQFVYQSRRMAATAERPGERTLRRGIIGRLFAVLALVTFLSFGLRVQAGEWPLEGGNEQRQRSSEERPGSVLYPRWSFRLPERFRSSPVLAGERVFLGSESGRFYALDEKTGAVLWSLPSSQRIRSSPTVDQDRVFLSDYGGLVRAVEASSGRGLWEFPTAGWISGSLLAAQDLVLFGSSDGSFYALDAVTGALRWRYDTGNDLFRAGAALAGKRLVVGTHNGQVLALDSDSGRLLWSQTIPGKGALDSLPVITDDRVFVAASGDGGGLYALDLATGKQLWEYRSPDNKWQGLALRADLLVASEWGEVYGFNPGDYQLKWVFRHEPVRKGTRKYWPVIEAPLLTAEGVYIVTSFEIEGEPSRLILLDSTSGRKKAEWPLAEKAVAAPLVAEGSLYLSQVGRLDAWKGLTIKLDGQPVVFPDVAPFFDTGRVLAPGRFLATAMGARVTWLEEEEAAVLELNGRSLKLWSGRRKAHLTTAGLGSQYFSMDVTPLLQGGRLLVPVRFVAEKLAGATVTWEAETLTVRVESPPKR